MRDWARGLRNLPNLRTEFKAGGAAVAAKATGAVLVLLQTLVLTRTMTTEAYGSFVFIVTISFLAVLVATAGLPMASSRFISGYWARGWLSQSSLFLSFSVAAVALGGGVAAVAVWALLALFPDFRGDGLGLLTLGAFVVVLGLVRLFAEATRAINRPVRALVGEECLSRFLVVCVVLILAAMISGRVQVEHAMWASIGANLGVVAYYSVGFFRGGLRLVGPLRGRGRTRRLRMWLGHGGHLMFTPMFFFMLTQTDIVVLGMMTGPAEVAAYQIASRLAMFCAFVAMTINAINRARISRAYSMKRPDEVQHLIDYTNLFAVPTTLGIALILALGGPWFLGLFRIDPAIGYPILLVLVATRVIDVLFGPVNEVLAMTGGHARTSRINIICGLLNIGLNIIMVGLMGALGAAVATAVVTTLWNAWLYLEARRIGGMESSAVVRCARFMKQAV